MCISTSMVIPLTQQTQNKACVYLFLQQEQRHTQQAVQPRQLVTRVWPPERFVKNPSLLEENNNTLKIKKGNQHIVISSYTCMQSIIILCCTMPTCKLLHNTAKISSLSRDVYTCTCTCAYSVYTINHVQGPASQQLYNFRHSPFVQSLLSLLSNVSNK